MTDSPTNNPADTPLYFRQLLIGPMANFVYLIGSTTTREVVVVDPAWDIQALVNLLDEEDLKLSGILVTHTHADHVGGNMMGNAIEGVAELLELKSAPVYVHKSEADRFAIPNSELVRTDGHSTLQVGEFEIGFVHTPGHTPGSQCFKLHDRLVSGDTLFIGSCGRTDLPGSNPEDMYESLTQKLMKLDEQTLVFPGHNYAPPDTHTSIGREAAENPFMQFPSKTAFLQAMGYTG